MRKAITLENSGGGSKFDIAFYPKWIPEFGKRTTTFIYDPIFDHCVIKKGIVLGFITVHYKIWRSATGFEFANGYFDKTGYALYDAEETKCQAQS